jgi:two-component system cell cycle response regulator
VPPSERPRGRSSTAPDSTELLRPGRILIADDDRLARELLAAMLRNAGHSVDAVEDGQEALERVGQGNVDLVLLDIVMPRLSGLEACRLLKGMTVDTFLPVVLVTVKTDTQSRVEGLKIGADDYVCKPFEEAELLARVACMLRIKRLHEHVTVQKARFERLSVHDDMTGLYNYRYLHTRLNEEFKRAERYHEPFACVLVDIDQLRAINDLAGRGAGDLAIKRVAEGIKKCVREVDVVARYGGEEFLVVLPSTHFAGSVVVAERVWREVSGRPIEIEAPRDSDKSVRRGDHPEGRPRAVVDAAPQSPAASADPKWAGGPRELTVSIGVALYPSRDVRTKDALIRAAEAALTQAKREGGNRICVFQQQGYIYTPSIGGPRPAQEPAGSGGRGDSGQDAGPSSARGEVLAARGVGRAKLASISEWSTHDAGRTPLPSGADPGAEGPFPGRKGS